MRVPVVLVLFSLTLPHLAGHAGHSAGDVGVVLGVGHAAVEVRSVAV